jgi:hypothetical protein
VFIATLFLLDDFYLVKMFTSVLAVATVAIHQPFVFIHLHTWGFVGVERAVDLFVF